MKTKKKRNKNRDANDQADINLIISYQTYALSKMCRQKRLLLPPERIVRGRANISATSTSVIREIAHKTPRNKNVKDIKKSGKTPA